MGELILGRGLNGNELFVFRNGMVYKIVLSDDGTAIKEVPVIGSVRVDLASGVVTVDDNEGKIRMAWLRRTTRIVR
jgi:hypothetical protein